MACSDFNLKFCWLSCWPSSLINANVSDDTFIKWVIVFEKVPRYVMCTMRSFFQNFQRFFPTFSTGWKFIKHVVLLFKFSLKLKRYRNLEAKEFTSLNSAWTFCEYNFGICTFALDVEKLCTLLSEPTIRDEFHYSGQMWKPCIVCSDGILSQNSILICDEALSSEVKIRSSENLEEISESVALTFWAII